MLPRVLTWNVKDKAVVLTGASSGIGRETALGLARRGARLWLVCRDRGRGEKVREEARAAGSPAVELVLADLTVQTDVRRIPDQLPAAIDVLLHNAGAVFPRRERTVDGLEKTFALNHLAPFLLTQLVRDRLRARVVVVASQVEARGRIDFDDLQLERGYEPLRAYDQSKLANVLFTYELARRLAGTPVTANCLHPGVIATNLLADYMGKSRAIGGRLNALAYPGPKKGAETSLRLACDPELTGVTGQYFKPEGRAESSPASHDPELARRLWEVSERLTGTKP